MCSLGTYISIENVDAAANAYQEATDAADGLPSTHPIRLGLALNYSVFFFEIKEEQSEACKLAKTVSTYQSLLGQMFIAFPVLSTGL